ncbi:MAG: hypothetical protein GWO21_11760 [Gammaproteobacteria bacterium]|nr:hypothetical protein [Gammaproteobacteria bacterium]
MKKLVLIGEAADAIRDAVGPSVDAVIANGMDEAVAAAWIAADPGDVVLLSPACASFDMFKGYAHRGEVFQAAVGKVTKRKRRTR